MTRVADYTEELCESQRMHLKLVQNANRGYHLQLPLDAAMKRQSIQLADAFICVSSCQSVINISSITTSEAGQDRRRRRRSLSSGDWLPSIGDAGHAYEIYNWRTLLKVNGFLNFLGEEASKFLVIHHAPIAAQWWTRAARAGRNRADYGPVCLFYVGSTCFTFVPSYITWVDFFPTRQVQYGVQLCALPSDNLERFSFKSRH